MPRELAPRRHDRIRRTAGHLTYAVRHMTSAQPGIKWGNMPTVPSSHPSRETAADLRALYRAAEARAARLRVIVEAGRSLASSAPDSIDTAAHSVAQEAAHLAGFARGIIMNEARDAFGDDERLCLPLEAPANEGMSVGTLVLEHRIGMPSAEDREALGIIAQLIGGALAAQAREDRLATLLAELLGAQEAERSRVAHELHDGVAQSAAALARRIDLAKDGDPADLDQAADQARALVRELRQVIAGMRPPALDDLGLAPALQQLVDDAADALDVALTIDLDARPAPAIETALFRVVQEGLNNARAHAGTGARAKIHIRKIESRFVVEISDDGQGFDPDSLPISRAGQGLGLAYMRERIDRLGGWLKVTSAPGEGCRLLTELPAA